MDHPQRLQTQYRTAFLTSGMPTSGINVHFFVNEAIPATVIQPNGMCMDVSTLPSIKNSYFGLNSNEEIKFSLNGSRSAVFSIMGFL